MCCYLIRKHNIIKVLILSYFMVEVGTGTVGTRFIETDWPNEEGLIAGTTKQTEDPDL